MKKPDFPYYLTSFLGKYLPGQKNVSRNTIESYAVTFKPFFFFCESEKNLKTEKITIHTITCQLILEYLKPGSKSDDYPGSHRIACLLVDAIGNLCRVAHRKQVKEAVQFLFGIHGQQLIDLPDVLSLRRESMVYIQHKGFQQVHLRVVPEMVAFRGAGVF